MTESRCLQSVVHLVVVLACRHRLHRGGPESASQDIKVAAGFELCNSSFAMRLLQIHLDLLRRCARLLTAKTELLVW